MSASLLQCHRRHPRHERRGRREGDGEGDGGRCEGEGGPEPAALPQTADAQTSPPSPRHTPSYVLQSHDRRVPRLRQRTVGQAVRLRYRDALKEYCWFTRRYLMIYSMILLFSHFTCIHFIHCYMLLTVSVYFSSSHVLLV